ncbi:MAG TPA: FAD-dependent oxidoreductase [Nitrospirota bacterium]|nr:FAD-dependent oxidoreductase [Nitrospirota bacterium]
MSNPVVIVGGGFGGLEAAFTLKGVLGPSAEITLIDRSPYHAFIPSIHLIVSRRAGADAIRIPLRAVLGPAGVRFMQDEVLSVDAERGQVVTAAGGGLAYDHLLLASGATNNFFDVPGAEAYSCRFRTTEDAERIQAALLKILGDTRPGRIVVAGAGTEGVEVIGEVLDLIRDEGRERALADGGVALTLIEGKGRLLPNFPAEVHDRVEEYLRLRGVTLIAGDAIAEVRQDSVVLASGQRHEASILIWSGGIQPSKLIRDLPFDKDPWGWLKVNGYLQIPEDERISGIGDAVSVYVDDGPLALQRLAYHAQDQARVAALNIASRIRGGKPVIYEPKSRPQLISLGRDMGIMTADDKVLTGRWVISAKAAVERKHLMTCLARPVTSAIWARIPGAGVLQRLRTRLPV